MSVQVIIDATEEYTSGTESGTPFLVKLDTGGFDYAVVQFVGIGGEVAFKHTNDSGAINGVSDGSAVSSANALALQGVNLASGATATSTLTASIFRFQSYARFLWIDGTATSATLDKLIVRLYKIC
jgi:hypothetical protein